MPVLEYEKQGHVVILTMNRPEKLNARNLEMSSLFADYFTEFERDDSAWVAVLTGRGRAFCSGVDMAEGAANRDRFPEGIHPERDPFDRYRLHKPTIAAINGLAYGSGFFLAGRADLRVAVEGAMFQASEIQRSMLGDYGCQVLHSLGSGVATELALGGTVTATRLYEVGFLNRLVMNGKALETAMEMAEQLIELPPLALQQTLRLMHELRSRTITRPVTSPHLGEDFRISVEGAEKRLRDSEDAKEARQSFLEKRRPSYRGE